MKWHQHYSWVEMCMTGQESPILFTSPLAWLSLSFLFPVNNYLHVRCRDCVEQKWRASLECYWNSILNKMCNRAGLLNTDELPSAVSQWIHLDSNTDTHTLLEESHQTTKSYLQANRRHAGRPSQLVLCTRITCWDSSYVSPSGSSIASPWPSMASCPYSSGCRDKI